MTTRTPRSQLFPYTTLFRSIRNEAIATEQRNLATAREKEARLRLADVFSGNGHVLLDKGDSGGALLWYARALPLVADRSEEHTSELQSRQYLVCRLLLEKNK